MEQSKKFKIEIDRHVLKILEKLEENYKRKIIEVIDKLEDFPKVRLDIKKLKGKENEFRVIIGDYRLIFELDKQNKLIIIKNLGRRENIY